MQSAAMLPKEYEEASGNENDHSTNDKEIKMNRLYHILEKEM